MATRSATSSRSHGARKASPGRRGRPGPRHREATVPVRKVRATRPNPARRESEPRPFLRWLASVAGKAMLGVLILAIFVFGVFPTGSYWEQRQQLDDAEGELAELRADNQELEAQIVRLGSDAEIEREAREEFNLVRPNEESYLVLPPGE